MAAFHRSCSYVMQRRLGSVISITYVLLKFFGVAYLIDHVMYDNFVRQGCTGLKWLVKEHRRNFMEDRWVWTPTFWSGGQTSYFISTPRACLSPTFQTKVTPLWKSIECWVILLMHVLLLKLWMRIYVRVLNIIVTSWKDSRNKCPN